MASRRGEGSSGTPCADVVIEPASDVAGDALAASRIAHVALDDLARRHGRPPLGAADDHAAPALRHVVESGGRLLLARSAGQPIAFGASWRRGALVHCAGLFVLPEWQGQGLGRRLFTAALEGLPAGGGVVSLTSSAANPVSNGLYARHGVYPQHALLELHGPTAASELPGGIHVEPLDDGHLEELRVIDAVVLEADRTLDHRWFLSKAGQPGWLFRRRGRAIGYVYLGGDGGEGPGAVGPAATLRTADQPAVLRYALSQLHERGDRAATVTVPGPNVAAQGVLWRAGFRFDAATGLLCASRAFGRFDRYLLAGDILL